MLCNVRRYIKGLYAVLSVGKITSRSILTAIGLLGNKSQHLNRVVLKMVFIKLDFPVCLL